MAFKGTAGKSSSGASMSKYDVEVEARLQKLEASVAKLVQDHENFANPSVISLTCKAVKKFIPYDGFYPAQRTVKLAQTFYDSYLNYYYYHLQIND